MLIKCKICEKEFDSYYGLAIHIKRHDLDSESYYNKYLAKEGEGFCLNCSKKTYFRNINLGYVKFCSRKCAAQDEFNPRFGAKLTEEHIQKIKDINSHKKKTIKCLVCSKEIIVTLASKRKFCSLSCRTIHRNKTDNPMLDDATRLKMAESQKARLQNPENHGMFGKKHSAETKDLLSLKQSERILREGFEHIYKYCKSGWFYSEKSKKEIWYSSGFELKFFQLLEKQAHILKYDRCNFYINYELDGSSHRYHPDLFIEYCCGENEFVELKPKFYLTDEKVKAKIVAAEKYANEKNLKFSIWTEEKLLELE